MLSGKDKLYHILACASITIITFVALLIAIEFYKKICVRQDGDGANNDNDVDMTTTPSSREINDSCRIFSRPCPKKYLILAGFSGIASMTIGIAKEIGDAYNIWPHA